MKKEMVPCTVRLNVKTWEIVRQVASENHISVAEVIRYCVTSDLCKYVRLISYIDKVQGAEIQKNLLQLINEMEEIRVELHRIGVNFNQYIRILNTEYKYNPSRSHTHDDNVLSKNDLEDIMRRYEAATQKVGDLLCRTLG